MPYKYRYTKRAVRKIRTFYRNVSLKYRHAYSYEDMERNVRDAIFYNYAIERTLLRRQPTIRRWEGYYMANTDKWYYAKNVFLSLTTNFFPTFAGSFFGRVGSSRRDDTCLTLDKRSAVGGDTNKRLPQCDSPTIRQQQYNK